MSGLFSDIGNFFTGADQDAAKQRQQQELKNANALQAQGTKASTAAENTLGENAQNAQALGTQLQGQTQQANQGVRESVGANAAEGAQLANQSAQNLATQNARLSATQAARQSLAAARTGGLNQGQAALAAGQQVGGNYMGGYQQGLGQGLSQYNTAVSQQQGQAAELAGQGQAQQSLSNQAAGQQGTLGVNQQATGLNAANSITGQQLGQANTEASSGGAFIGQIGNAVGNIGNAVAKLLKDGTESHEGGPAIVGDGNGGKGMELIPNLPAGTQVISNSGLRKLVRASGGPANPTPKEAQQALGGRKLSRGTPEKPEVPDMTSVLMNLTKVLEGLSAKINPTQEAS
jgi:hypothetical protein